jgi:hypothetical protein
MELRQRPFILSILGSDRAYYRTAAATVPFYGLAAATVREMELRQKQCVE